MSLELLTRRLTDRLLVPIAFVAVMTMVSSVDAQKHELIRSDLAPGIAAQYKLLGNPAMATHVQPVRVVAPNTTRLSVVSNGGFTELNHSSQTVGLRIGPLYRFKVSGVYENKEHELFPSIELLDRLHPPAGLENHYPVMVVISDDDLKQAIAGHLVTKVIYLEDAETALPRVAKETEQPFFDISSAEDPLRTAEGLGRPMAILRIGSRVPTSEELTNVAMSAFNSESPEFLPQVSPIVDSEPFEVRVPDMEFQAFEMPNMIRTQEFAQPLSPLNRVNGKNKMNVTTWQNLSDQD